MRNLLIIFVAIIVVQQWDNIADLIIPPKDYSYLAGTPVTLYSTDWCRYCAKAKKFMDRNQIAYQEHDIEKSTAARQEYDNYGGSGVPLIVIDKNVIKGYQPDLMLEYLDNIQAKPAPNQAT